METLQKSLRNDRATRLESVQTPKVYTLNGSSTELLPPGSGAVIIADPTSNLFDELERAVEAQDAEKINEIVTRNKRSVSRLKKVSNREALQKLSAAPTYVDLNYDTRNIAVNLFTVNGVDITRAFFSFTGGEFEPERFRATVLSNKENQPTPKIMVVLHQPNLSRLELEAVRIPKESAGMHFGKVGGEVMCTPAALVATVTVGVLVATVGTAVGNCAGHFGKIGEEVINPQIDAGRMISVKELVNIRQQAIQKNMRIR